MQKTRFFLFALIFSDAKKLNGTNERLRPSREKARDTSLLVPSGFLSWFNKHNCQDDHDAVRKNAATTQQERSTQKRSTRQSRVRLLRLEGLQSRELMAADCFVEFETAASANVSAVVANTDPGSTLSTALDLGSIDGSLAATGSLSFRDRLDIFSFDIVRDGTVDIDLGRLSRNVDLVLADDSGSLLDTSRLGGRTSESISAELEAGTYFVGVQARSFWGSGYQLNLDVQLSQPVVEVPVTEVPVAEIPGDIAPFSDVDYFGGTREWNLNAVNSPEAWAAGFTGEGITIAVVDTGVDLDHPDLVNNLYVNAGEISGNGIDDDGNGYVDDIHGYDFAGRDADPNDVGGHGTHVAGTIAAGLNGFGATGVAPDATILPVRVLGDNGSGSTNAVAAGIRYAAEQGADVINLSLGGGFSSAIQAAIDYADQLGSFIVAAAGNEGASSPGFPARFSSIYENVLSVGAHNNSNQIAGFSNDVGTSNSVQIDAPGVGIFSTYVGGRYAFLSGTSMAAPQVAGVAALALSANPNLTPSELRSLLVGGTTTAAIGSDALGIVNAATTVAYAAAGLSSPPIESSSSALAGATGNASSFRTISFDGEVVAAPSESLASSHTTEETFTSDSFLASIDTATVEKQASFAVAQADSDASDVIEIVAEDRQSNADAVDLALDAALLDSLV